MTLGAPAGPFTFLLDEGTGDFLTDDNGQFYLIADIGLFPPSTTDRFAYIFKFSDNAAASRDTIVGQFYGNPQTALEVLVFADVSVNSVNANSGYWCLVSQTGLSSSLTNHPNVELVIDTTLFYKGLVCVVLAKIPTAHVGVVFNAFSVFIVNGVS